MTSPYETVRNLVGRCGDSTAVDDASIHASVNRHSMRMNAPLTGMKILTGGRLRTLLWVAEWGDWTEETIIFDGRSTLITPANADLVKGEWMLAAEPYGAVYVQGQTVDVYSAAADCLDSVASELAGELQSFTGQGGSFTYGPKGMGYSALAKEYRSKARVYTHRMERIDVFATDPAGWRY